MINDGLKGTSVTVFLLGAETAGRKWVRYELQKSCENGNGLLAVYIHQIKNLSGLTSQRGANIMDQFHVTDGQGNKKLLSSIYKSCDWKDNEGYKNFGIWVEAAAKQVGK